MLTLCAKIRKISGKKVKQLRAEGMIPAVLYGPKIKSLKLQVPEKEFVKVYKEAGESTIIKLKVESEKLKVNENLALIKDISREPLTDEILHIDFFQPRLDQEIEAVVPLIFEGKSLAVEENSGTLVKNLSEIEVKALPQDLPKEIRVDIGKLKTFEHEILVKDLNLPEKVQLTRSPDEVIAVVSPPEKVEQELEEPIEEKVEEVEKVEEKEAAGDGEKVEEAKPEEEAREEEKEKKNKK